MRRATTRNRHYTQNRQARIRGPGVLEALTHAQNQLRENLRELQRASNDFDDRMDRFVTLRSDEFVRLAKHYLPELTAKSIEQSFFGVRSELMTIFEDKKRRQQDLESSIDRAQQHILQAQSETDRVTIDLNHQAEERDRLQEVVSNRLKNLPEYKELTSEATVAESRLTQNEERLSQVREEAGHKKPSYEDSRLFMYLYDRRYGTPDYRSRGLTKRIDRWLARYIGFAKARKSYEFLKVTPELMAAELQRRRDSFDSLMNQIENLELRIENEVGLTQVVEEGERLGLKRDELLNQIEDYNLQLEQFESELNIVQEAKGQYYGDAISKMRKHLEETEAARLQERANDTIDPLDDRIVADIVELDEHIAKLHPEIALLSAKRKQLTDKQAGLDDIIRRFRSSNFDSHRSVFPDDFEMGKLVGRFLNNVLDARALWKQIRNSQKFQESWAQQTATDVLNEPSAQIVLHTMLDLAKTALKNSARRSVFRRNSSRSGGGGITWPKSSSRRSRSSSRRSSSNRRSKPRKRRGGFTSGDGF